MEELVIKLVKIAFGVGVAALLLCPLVVVAHLVWRGAVQQSGYFPDPGLQLAAAHFGLGAADSVDSLRIRWPDSSSSAFEDVGGFRMVTIAHPSLVD